MSDNMTSALAHKDMVLELLGYIGRLQDMPRALREKTVKLVLENFDKPDMLAELKHMLVQKMQAEDVHAIRALPQETSEVSPEA